ncbi:MAG: O-antigen ligase family protein [Anaerolineae bacterium]|nr:O-antigen ligase family protein [Anaerolineae bacterium]
MSLPDTFTDWFSGRLPALFGLVAALLSGLLLVLLPLPLATGLLIAGALALLLLITPLAALTLMLILAPLRTLIATESPLQLPLDIGQLTFLLLLGVWGLDRIRNRRPLLPVVWSPVLVPVLLFTAAGGLTVFSAVSHSAWLTEWLKWLIIPLLMLLTLALGQRGGWRWLLLALVVSGVANALVGIYIYFGGSGADHLLISAGRFRAFGTFGQPNPFGGFLGLLTPLALALAYGSLRHALARRRSAGQWYPADLLPVAFYGLAALVMSAAIIMSWSRGAWLALLAAVAVLVFALPRRSGQSLLIVLAGGSLFALLWFSGALPESIVNRITSSTAEFFAFDDMRGVDITGGNYAVVERLAHWQAALNIAHDHPWLGVGMGNYEIVYADYRLLNWPFPLGHAHNYYLNILAEAGMIGLLAYVSLWTGIFWFTWRTRRHPDPRIHSVAAGLLGTWTYLAMHSLLDNLYVNNVFLHLGVLLGVLAVLYQQTWSALIWEST